MTYAIRTLTALLAFAVVVPHLGAQRLQWDNISGGMVEGIAGIHMLNGTYIAAGMNPGGVFLSSDKGFTWTAANNGLEDTRVTSLVFQHDERILYAATASGDLYVSHDNAASWGFHSTLPDALHRLHVSGARLYAYGTGGDVMMYENTWLPLYSKMSDAHNATSFVRLSNGMLFVGTESKGLYRSTDEGIVWQNMWPNDARIEGIFPSWNDSILIINTAAGLRLSDDYGDTWEVLTAPSETQPPVLDLGAFDGESFTVIDAETRQLYSTGDKGAKWIPFPESPEFEQVFVTGNGYFIGASRSSGISATSDWGATWYTGMHSMAAKNIPSIQSYMPVPSVASLYMGGKYTSTDGGSIWTRYPEAGPHDWRDSVVYDNLKVRHAGAWYMAAGTALYISDSQGEQWIPLFDLEPELVVDYAFQPTTARDIVLISDAQLFYYFDSQGMTANGWNSPVAHPGLLFVSSDRNVLVGDTATMTLWRSSDQGESWTELTGIAFSEGQEILEYEPGVLLLGAYISHDDGATWTLRTLLSESAVPEVLLIRKDIRGNVYYGTEHGVYIARELSNSLVYEGLPARITALEVLGDGSIAAGGPGLGIRRANTDVLTSVDPVPQPVRVALMSSAPNPFSGGTTVTLDLERTASVTLAVYNTLGMRIATLASGHRSSGQHVFHWNGLAESGVRVPPGSYSIRLTTPTGMNTLRVLKMR